MMDRVVEWMIYIVIAVVAAGVVGGIGYTIYAEINRPTQGEVVGKEYVPERTETKIETREVGEKIITVPKTTTYPEQYIITIKGWNKKEKEVKYSFRVTKEEYLQIDIGQWYVLEK